MVGGYTDNLEKAQNCQNWGWALARDNTVFTIFSHFVCKWASTMILLFDVWIENVVNLVNQNQKSSLSGQDVNREDNTFQE